jgi:hypothetical protein
MAIARCQNCGKPESRKAEGRHMCRGPCQWDTRIVQPSAASGAVKALLTYGSTSKKRRPSIQGSESFVFLLSQRRSALKRLPKSN